MPDMLHVRRYDVLVHREPDWWMFAIPQLGAVGQARQRDRARWRPAQ